ncbi:MAG: RHS repeat-associated core domain-containing protein, partial [Lachnospiraceae bacterium]|nr:RHS repeat-associated core domain-containing protein [Lachnospiraceae bacterium]
VTRVIDRNGKATVYEYDELGNRSAVRYPNGNVVTYTYDACQRLKEEWVVNESGVTLAKYTYGLGKAGERTSITELSNGIETETTYKYDKLNRLIKETIERNDSSIINEFEYDAASNRISKETTVKGDVSVFADVDNEEIKVTEGTTTYTYNALNQLVTELSEEGTITYTFDDNGNLVKQTGDKTVDYSYDKENRLLRATIQKGNSVTIESYTYDYAGNRTSKTINEIDTTYYVNDTSGSLTMVVAETDKAGKEIAYYTRGDELLSMENGNEIWYYLYDGHGSVRTLTNEAGRVTDRYAYDAYGNLLEKEGDSKNEFLYTGEQYNANTGLYYLRARYMNPSTGTFISMDSYQGSIYDPVTLHKYLYANANPVMYTDPSGYSSLKENLVIVGIAGVIATGIAFANQTALNIFSSLRRNLNDATVISEEVTVTQADWKNLIIDFPSHNYDKEWLVTTVMWLASWHLFKAIYEIEETDTEVDTPGVPENKDEDDEEKDGKKEGCDTGKDNSEYELREVYDSIKQSPKYPKGFQPRENGTTVHKVNNKQLLQKLKQIESGIWKKVYKDGYDTYGNKVSIHYFRSQSGKVFNVKVKPGWSN